MPEIDMPEDWEKAVSDVGDGEVYLLLQGYPMTGFASVTKDRRLSLPSDLLHQVLDWNLFWDVRMFGQQAEWHAWRNNVGAWNDRLAKPGAWPGAIERSYVLWGNTVSRAQGGWACCHEQRGAEVWVPEQVARNGLPVRLRVLHRVEYEPHTGLAGITDAMICGFEGGDPR